MCGEKCMSYPLPLRFLGSPPRVRGKADSRPLQIGGLRITPACAGKSRTASTSGRTAWDHPRVCGEKYYSLNAGRFSVGSPPRVRGKGIHPAESRTGDRITPACAGKRLASKLHHPPKKDHPRVCGEKLETEINAEIDKGSPPRVRGKGRRSGASGRAPRITPACAGKRQHLLPSGSWWWDHPRVCGEKFQTVGCKAFHLGSPPRVRGKVLIGALVRRQTGITPACAGKRFPARNSLSL